MQCELDTLITQTTDREEREREKRGRGGNGRESGKREREKGEIKESERKEGEREKREQREGERVRELMSPIFSNWVPGLISTSKQHNPDMRRGNTLQRRQPSQNHIPYYSHIPAAIG